MVNKTPARGNAPRFRVIAAAAVATLLLGSSFYGARAGNNSGYSDHLSGLEIAGIATGAVGGGLVIAGIMRDKHDDDDQSSAPKTKSANAGTVSALRVISSQKQMTSGDATSVAVQARFEGSDTWTDVTDRASVSLAGGALTQLDGAKNAFAIPYGSKVVPGNATIEASFGGQQASTTVSVN